MQSSRLRLAFLSPAVLILALFFLVPLCIVIAYSFMTRGAYGGVAGDLSFESYARLFDPLYLRILFRSLVMALSVTLGCLLMAFPLALFITRAGSRKHLYLQLVMLPFWTSFLVRTYAWMFLLRDTGLINSALLAVGVINQPLPLLYNDGAVFFGLLYSHLPFAVLPIFSTLERLDKSLLEAAADLGGKPWESLLHVLLPLSAPGLAAAALLTFVATLGAYLTPDLLGGGKSVMIGTLIQNQFTTARDWPFGSALSIIIVLAVSGLIYVWSRKTGAEAL